MPSPTASAPASPAVLLVDDRPENLVAFEAALAPLAEETGARLLRAGGADEALRHVLAEGEAIAVILLDVMMPGTDGLATARLIRERRAAEHVPIIFVTALDADRRRVTAGYLSGAVDYLTKPVDPDVLQAKVRAFVDLHRRRTDVALAERRRFADRIAESEAAVRASDARLRPILESGIVGLFFWDLAGGITEANDAFLALLGYTQADLAAGRVDWRRMTPPEYAASDAAKVNELLATGTHGPYEKAYRAKDGHAVPVLIASAFVDAARTHGVCVCIDLRERRQAEAERERALRDARLLQQVTAALSAAVTRDAVIDALLEHGVSAFGAATGLVLLRSADGAALARAGSRGYSETLLPILERIPLDACFPAADAVRRVAPVWVESREEGMREYPDAGRVYEAGDFHATAALPLEDGAGRPFGALVFHFAVPRRFGPDAQAVFEALARQCAQALERARLFEAEHEARAEAEAARRRVAFLAEASARLAGSLEVEATLRAVADLTVPALADWCFVEVRDDDGIIRPAAVVHRDPAKVALAYDVLRRYPIDPAASFGTGHVLRTGQPELAPEIPDDVLVAVARDAEHLAVLREIGFRSSLSVPLTGQNGRPVAVLSLVAAESGRRFGPADLAMAEEVARRAGAALASARLYAAEQAALRRATALQQVTATLSGALTAEEAAAVVLEQSVTALHARAGVVLRATDGSHGATTLGTARETAEGPLDGRADGERLEIVRSAGSPPPLLRAWGHVPADAPVPLAEAVRTRAPVYVESVATWAARYGESALLQEFPAACSWAALPFVVEGRVLGALGLSFAREGALAPEDRAFATALAQQCAQAFERARLYAAERVARTEAERRREEAEAAAAAKGQFLAVMSHELRTPLNAQIGYAELLDLELAGPLTAAQRDYLARLTASSRHLLTLINDVLDFSKIDAGELAVAQRAARTGPAVRSALDLMRPQADARGVRLEGTGNDAGVAYVGDDQRVVQVLTNLVSNAVKFTPPGGRVTVADGVLAEAPPAAHVYGAGPWAYVRVEDTGVGIAPEEQARIFDPFHQVDGRANAYTRTAGGTGLGLSISRRLARLMGGDLTVASAPGAGAAFTLWLPALSALPRGVADGSNGNDGNTGAETETAGERRARAERDAVDVETLRPGDVGQVLRASVDEILAAYTERLRADPAVPRARDMRRLAVEDHVVSFLADLAQSLVIADGAGPGDAGHEAADLLRDGSAIQRVIAEHHGARRQAQGWDEAAVRRDHQVFREEVERAVRGRLRAGTGRARAGVDDVVRVLLGLIDHAEAISVGAWRRAAGSAGIAGRAPEGDA